MSNNDPYGAPYGDAVTTRGPAGPPGDPGYTEVYGHEGFGPDAYSADPYPADGYAADGYGTEVYRPEDPDGVYDPYRDPYGTGPEAPTEALPAGAVAPPTSVVSPGGLFDSYAEYDADGNPVKQRSPMLVVGGGALVAVLVVIAAVAFWPRGSAVSSAASRIDTSVVAPVPTDPAVVTQLPVAPAPSVTDPTTTDAPARPVVPVRPVVPGPVVLTPPPVETLPPPVTTVPPPVVTTTPPPVTTVTPTTPLLPTSRPPAGP